MPPPLFTPLEFLCVLLWACLKAFTVSSLSCWAMCPTPCFLSSFSVGACRPFRLASRFSRVVAISMAFSRVRFSAVTHFLSTSCLPMLATNCCRISDSNSLNWQFLASCLRRMANSFAVSPSCLDARRKTITSVNTTVFGFTWATSICRISSYVSLLSSLRLDR